jgi:uncharacterized membrane protein YjfL (UPF0719 family)
MNILILLQAFLAFGIGISSLFLVYVFVRWYMKKALKAEIMNDAYAIFKVGIIIASALLMSSVIGPGINAIRYFNQGNLSWHTAITSTYYILLFVVIGVLFSFMVIAGGIVVLFQLTHVNEWDDIKSNNIHTALISAALIIGLAIIMKEQVTTVCEMFIPYPEVMQIK